VKGSTLAAVPRSACLVAGAIGGGRPRRRQREVKLGLTSDEYQAVWRRGGSLELAERMVERMPKLK